MEIIIDKNLFLKAISITAGVVGLKNTLPILNNILIQTTPDNQIEVTGTDLEIGIQTKCQCKVNQQGSVTAPAKKLHDIIRELPEGELEFVVSKNTTINIKSKKTYFKIAGLEATDYPAFQRPAEENSFDIDAGTLKHCLEVTVFAASRDETRYTLNGVLLSIKNSTVRFIATDGKRLAVVERKINTPKDFNADIIVPSKTVGEITKTFSDSGTVRITSSQNQIAFVQDQNTIVSRVIEGKFPNYEQVIPKEEKTTAKLNHDEFLAAVKRMALLTSQESQPIKLDFTKGKVLVSARTPNLGEAKEEIDADVNGEDLAIGFNPGYLIDVLKNVSTEQVSVSLTGADRPGLIRNGSEYLYVVMPMQLTY